ncbi:MAG: ABC transporter permease [Candidatus Thorarchaeota archaeon]|jgi:peptide/nickel transport system permease protein
MEEDLSQTTVTEIEVPPLEEFEPKGRIIGLFQIAVAVFAIGLSLTRLAFEFLSPDTNLGLQLGMIVLNVAPVVLAAMYMINAGKSVRRSEFWTFISVIYSNLIVMILSLLIGGIMLPLIVGNVVAIALIMRPSVRKYWWGLFMEDMGPRMKETRYSLYLIRKSPLVIIGISILLGYAFLGIFTEWIAPFGPTERIWTENFAAPGSVSADGRVHWWGTGQSGIRVDLRIAFAVVSVAIVIGTFIGAAAGYFGGAFDEVMMRITDVFFAFPGLILAMAIVAALGARSLDNIAIALMVVWWPGYARLVRGQVLLEREKLYVEAARSVGASDFRILVTHMLPNTVQPMIVSATLDLGGVLLTAAGLSFIGFGAEAGSAEWGLMIAQGQEHFYMFWLVFFPGMAILLASLAFNLIGDGVRDILDPKLRRR